MAGMDGRTLTEESLEQARICYAYDDDGNPWGVYATKGEHECAVHAISETAEKHSYSALLRTAQQTTDWQPVVNCTNRMLADALELAREDALDAYGIPVDGWDCGDNDEDRSVIEVCK